MADNNGNNPGVPGTPEWTAWWANFRRQLLANGGQQQARQNHGSQIPNRNNGIHIGGSINGTSIMMNGSTSVSVSSTMNGLTRVMHVNNFSIRSRGVNSSGVTLSSGMEIRFRLQDGDVFQTAQTAGRRIRVRIADRNGTRRRDRGIKIRVPRGGRVGNVIVDQVGGEIVIRINDI